MSRPEIPEGPANIPLLEARDLTVKFGGLVAVDRVDFAVMPGEIVGLIGPNGAGKSTLVNALTALVRHKGGDLLWQGAPVRRRLSGWRLAAVIMAVALWTLGVSLLAVSPEALWEEAVLAPMAAAWQGASEVSQLDPRSGWHPVISLDALAGGAWHAFVTRLRVMPVIFGLASGSALASLWHRRTRADAPRLAQLGLLRTFQNLRLFSSMTVAQHLDVARYAARGRNGSDASMVDDTATVLEQVGLADKADRLATSLAYGEMRRLEVARALAGRPRVLVLDEPAAGLGAQERRRLTELLGSLRRQGLAVVLIEHDMELVMRVCDRLVVLDHGQKIAEGRPETIKRHPAVVAAYLGLDAASAETELTC